MKFKNLDIKKLLTAKTLILVLLFGNVFMIGAYLISKYSYNKERKALIEAYEIKLTENIEEQLKLVTTTFVWSIRSEMLRDNFDQVDLYFNQLVKKDDHITEIIAVDEKGEIVVSTNKRYEGKAFSQVYDKSLLNNNRVTILNEDETFKIIAPIMALNNQIGTLFMIYQPDEAMLKIIPEKEKKEIQSDSLDNRQEDVEVLED